MALGFNKFLGNQGANFNCHPSNIVVNCISIYIMVILDNSRTLGAFERQSRILHILFIIFIFASEKRNILIILIYRFMKKEVTIQNTKFNLSTKSLVSEPEVYPDYPSVQVNQITNKIITNFINYLPDYPWYEYIYNSNNQFDENLPELINTGNHFISIYINTDDCLIEFSTEQPDSSDNLCEDYSFTTADITFTVYFD